MLSESIHGHLYNTLELSLEDNLQYSANTNNSHYTHDLCLPPYYYHSMIFILLILLPELLFIFP